MIPEITKSQLKLMRQISLDPNMSVFSQTAPMPTDTLENQIYMKEGEDDVARLVELGLVKNITENHLEQVQKTNEVSGRTWRIYEIQPLGRAFFQADQSVLVH